MIEIKNVSKSFGQEKVLRDINLSVSNGELLVLLGPSGAGKSTLLRCINGLEVISGGTIHVSGKEVKTSHSELRNLRKKVGMIFQQFHLIHRMSVIDNVLCGRLAYHATFPTLFKRFKSYDYEIAMHYLEKVGLSEKYNARADELSGGQQQRVAIARALVQEPNIILADEPVASLDPKTANTILELLTRIKEEEKLTIMITLHQIELAKKFGKRIIGLKDGRIMADLKAEQVSLEDLYTLYEDQEIESPSHYQIEDKKVVVHA
jgi:phosphonate transport system ATP-binding protein